MNAEWGDAVAKCIAMLYHLMARWADSHTLIEEAHTHHIGRNAYASGQAKIRERSAWLGVRSLFASGSPVSGEVWCDSSHFSMALRSKVWPSAVETGSTCVRGSIRFG